jgi:hypothetical protein
LTVADGYLDLEMEEYPKKADHLQDKDFWVDYYYVKDFGNTDAGNFNFECRIRNNSDLGTVCRESRISIICTKGRFNIPICNPGCVSNINVTLGNLYLSGKQKDLSVLGCDLRNWTDFQLRVEDNNCQISINQDEKLNVSYEGDLGRIVGFKFKFNGIGEVDLVSLKNLDDVLIFNDSFNRNLEAKLK